MRKILITGANGFIGRHVLPLFARNDWEVHAVGFRTPPVEVPGVVWHAIDLLDREQARRLMEEVHASHLLHLAWYAEPVTYWTSPENLRWVRGTLDMLDAFREAGGAHIIAAGTCAEYDWNYGYCREDATPLAPATVYGKCKLSLHHLLAAYGEVHGVRVAWGRVFYLYGPCEAPERLVPSVTRALLGGDEALCTHGRQVRDFLHVADAASAFVHLVEQDISGAINIGSGEPLVLRRLVEAIADELGARHLVRFGARTAPSGEAPLVVADTRLLRERGWAPAYDLTRGIAETVAWWRANDDRSRCERSR